MQGSFVYRALFEESVARLARERGLRTWLFCGYIGCFCGYTGLFCIQGSFRGVCDTTCAGAQVAFSSKSLLPYEKLFGTQQVSNPFTENQRISTPAHSNGWKSESGLVRSQLYNSNKCVYTGSIICIQEASWVGWHDLRGSARLAWERKLLSLQGTPWLSLVIVSGRNALQHTATHCNTLQHIATHCNTLQHTQHTATHCNTLQHTATHCNTLQHTI